MWRLSGKMRPIVENEYARMRQQRESAISTMSEIAFDVAAKHSGDADQTHWVEYGFAADVRLTSPSTRNSSSGVFPVLTTYTDDQPGVAVLPLRYIINNAFVVREKNAWEGESFDILTRPQVQAISSPVAIAPYVEGIRLVNINGIAPLDNIKFDILSTLATADSFMINMTSKDPTLTYNLRTINQSNYRPLFTNMAVVWLTDRNGVVVPVYQTGAKSDSLNGQVFKNRR
jgi:hypothetical protein